ncbi:hypothetical protein HanOQP8_Chr10g0364251 [Helianthus annuus]|nr:hypothetical protein HanOQP8_Chr10g0364251 [Helianthus annuus]KAJ0883621.1 putative nitrate regulatory gene2 protein [Helianthus annuus]
MGCVATKLEEEEEVVSICRERKQLLKLAVEKRYSLAEAHFRYCQSVYGVSAAIKLFVARHSSSSSPFLITLPPPSPPKENKLVSNPLFLQQKNTSQKTKDDSNACGASCCSCSSSSSDEERESKFKSEREQEQEEGGCGYYYMDMGSSMPPPEVEFGWDFFDPFVTMRPEVMRGYNRYSDDDLRVVREEEGIPELEEEVEEVKNKVVVSSSEEEKKQEEESCESETTVGCANVSQGEAQKGLTVIDTPERGRELLETLKDIEDYFIRIYHSGKGVSKMLESNRIQLQSGLEEIKGRGFLVILHISHTHTHHLHNLICVLIMWGADLSNKKRSKLWLRESV